ncbi:hypothetical protein OU798_08595 [Prolixibacteraceae bacterium Z1-6]|uniref:Uncharacterized protein n=1 Tax=Draconibacterium aestuarii TaxID=2998507 RepID=A0A9X3FD30_9BACT|nr:hypothetical protein [Prolixibacteraceae bacterium Z1-6]
MNKHILIILCFALFFVACKPGKQDAEKMQIRGWNILTDHTPTAFKTLKASADYHVNHLQLSHNICHNLKDVKHQWNRNIVNRLTEEAHEMGIQEVVVWDHALYNLDYYPDRFKINDTTRINLDDPKFWKWFKKDYRKMLDKVPEIDGIVLTFIETGARVENQYSEVLKTPEEKLAALVDSVASVVVKERDMKLYIRSFMYNRTELSQLMNCFDLIKTPGIVVMAKETPHDFFITHPVSQWIKDIPFPVIIEFDCAHEFNGQGIVASIFPETHLERWKYYQDLPNVIGYSLRTDRYNNTSIIGTPSEINLYAVAKSTGNPGIEIDEIIESFIAEKFDSVAVPYLKPLFEIAPEIILSSFYTLGLNTTNHSRLNFDYRSIYTRHVSGRWLDNPEITVGHGVNQTFHYWSDIVNHLSPVKYKLAEGTNLDELCEVFENNWLQPEELMDTTYLNYVLAEKEYGVQQAEKAMELIKTAKPYCSNADQYNILYHTFNRTLMSAKLRKAYAQVYYAQRIWNRGDDFRPEALQELIAEGLDEIVDVSEQITVYRRGGASGQYDWKNDATIALDLVDEINKTSIMASK